MRYSKFRAQACGRLCRRCINEQYGLQLTQENCMYMHFPTTCGQCGELHNIVLSVDLRSRWEIRRNVKHK